LAGYRRVKTSHATLALEAIKIVTEAAAEPASGPEGPAATVLVIVN
jgi:hypothetical protein